MKKLHAQRIEDYCDQIGWPLLPAMSSSTIDVVIVESPPPARRPLRHREKRSSLRFLAGSPHASATRPRPRLMHRVGRITDQDCKSVASDASVRTGVITSNVSQPWPGDVIPVVVIPQRSSSLQSSTSTSKNQSRNGSRPSLGRPHPISNMDDDAVVSTRGRHMQSSAVTQNCHGNSSASTSKENSRTTSLTSESLRQHTAAMDREMQKQPVKPAFEAVRAPAMLVETDGGTEPRRPSSLQFTHTSVQSSSPGLVEINEATLVSLFPHNNRSLLLIDERVLPESRAVLAVRTQYPGDRLDASLRTPEAEGQRLPENVTAIGSPLQNPRPPPKPPAYTVMPPTLAKEKHQLSLDEETRSRFPGCSPRPVRSASSVQSAPQRALTFQLPKSSAFVFPRSLSLRSARIQTPSSSRPSSNSRRLHPLWQSRSNSTGHQIDVDPKAKLAVAASEDAAGHVASGKYHYRQTPANHIRRMSEPLPQPRALESSPRLRIHATTDKSATTGTQRTSPQLSSGNLTATARGQMLRVRSPVMHVDHQKQTRQWRRLRVLSRWSVRFRAFALRDVRGRLRRTRQHREEVRQAAARRERIEQSPGEIVCDE